MVDNRKNEQKGKVKKGKGKEKGEREEKGRDVKRG